MRAILTLALKDLRLLSRDKFGLFWILVFPLVYALFFGSIAGGGSESRGPLDVAVVDEDHSPASQKFLADLNKQTALKTQERSRAEARDLVRQGNLVAYVVLTPGFGKGGQPDLTYIELGIDPRRQAEAGMLQGLLTATSFGDLPALFGGPKMSANPIHVVEVAREGRRFSSFEVTFPSAVLWGIMGCLAAFAISIVTERVAGTLLRLRVAPLSRGQFLAGKGLACFLASVAVALFLLLLGNIVFDVRLEDPAELALAIFCTGVCFVGIMMLMATIGKTQQSVAGAGWGILVLLAMFGGGMIPLVFMPDWMQTASNFSPIKWGILALEGAIWRGFSWMEMLKPCAILVSIGVVCFALGVKILERTEA
jgi:ABC-2 type transport system permease protein